MTDQELLYLISNDPVAAIEYMFKTAGLTIRESDLCEMRERRDVDRAAAQLRDEIARRAEIVPAIEEHY